jgi:hypothetical protein
MPKTEKDDKTTEVETEEVETETEEESEEEESEESIDPSKDQTDYKALAEAELQRRKDAEQALIKERIKRKKPEDEETEADDEYKPLTAKDLAAFEARIVERTQKELQESRALEVARRFTSSEAEAQAAVVYFKSRVVPTGNLEEDVQFAVAGMNSKKILAQNSELKRALKGKEAVSTTGDTHRDAPKGGTPKITSEIVASLKRAGFTLDGTSKRWIKKIGKTNGLYYDVREKKVLPLKA